MSTGASFARGTSKQNYATPPDFIAAVERRFGPINFDLAASPENTKHANYFSIRDNSLAQEWHKIPGNLWLNPPLGYPKDCMLCVFSPRHECGYGFEVWNWK